MVPPCHHSTAKHRLSPAKVHFCDCVLPYSSKDKSPTRHVWPVTAILQPGMYTAAYWWSAWYFFFLLRIRKMARKWGIGLSHGWSGPVDPETALRPTFCSVLLQPERSVKLTLLENDIILQHSLWASQYRCNHSVERAKVGVLPVRRGYSNFHGSLERMKTGRRMGR